MKTGAFTLAEVLITLGVIGVVAALTYPMLSKKYQEQAIITKYKKLYSTLANAYNLAIAENGQVPQWNVQTSTDFLKKLEPYLNVTEKCYNQKGCTTMGDFVSLSGESIYGRLNDGISVPKVRLNDGSSIIIVQTPNPDCVYNYTNPDGTITKFENICIQCYGVISNTKNSKYSNVYGKDFFSFDFTKEALLPTGYKTDDTSVEHSCSKKYSGSGNGDTCGTWILRHHNVDYLN